MADNTIPASETPQDINIVRRSIFYCKQSVSWVIWILIISSILSFLCETELYEVVKAKGAVLRMLFNLAKNTPALLWDIINSASCIFLLYRLYQALYRPSSLIKASLLFNAGCIILFTIFDAAIDEASFGYVRAEILITALINTTLGLLIIKEYYDKVLNFGILYIVYTALQLIFGLILAGYMEDFSYDSSISALIVLIVITFFTSIAPWCTIAAYLEKAKDAHSDESSAIPLEKAEINYTAKAAPQKSKPFHWNWRYALIGLIIIAVILLIISLCLIFRGGSTELEVKKVDAYMSLTSEHGKYYGPENLLDNDPSTMWEINMDESGLYDTEYALVFGPMFRLNANKVNEISITNGNGTNAGKYHENGRVKNIIIFRFDPYTFDGEVAENAFIYGDIPESDILYSGTVEDTMQPQTLKTASTYDNNRPTDWVMIAFPTGYDKVYHGNRFEDLCLADVKFFGKP